MEDLEARLAGAFALLRAQDTLPRQRLEHTEHRSLTRVGVRCEIVGRVRDLHAGRGDEMGKGGRRKLAALGGSSSIARSK